MPVTKSPGRSKTAAPAAAAAAAADPPLSQAATADGGSGRSRNGSPSRPGRGEGVGSGGGGGGGSSSNSRVGLILSALVVLGLVTVRFDFVVFVWVWIVFWEGGMHPTMHACIHPYLYTCTRHQQQQQIGDLMVLPILTQEAVKASEAAMAPFHVRCVGCFCMDCVSRFTLFVHICLERRNWPLFWAAGMMGWTP